MASIPTKATKIQAFEALPEAGDWFVLHTRSRQEKALTEELARMGVGVFLPLHDRVRYYGKRKQRVAMPMFPGYVFLRGSVDEAYLADRTRRVARIITVPDQTRIDWELHNLHAALRRQAPLDPYPYLRKGVRVEVTSGPFRGLQGVVQDRLHTDRLVLQVDMLGGAVAIEIDNALLAPIE